MGWFTLMLLAILIWLLYRLYKKEPKIYTDKPKEDYIISETSSEKRKPKKTKIEELISNTRKEREHLIQEREKITPKFQELGNGMMCIFKKKVFLFDQEGYEFFNDEFIIFDGLDIIEGYLVINNPANKFPLFFHRRFMRIDIEIFCEKNDLGEEDVIVHHIDFNKRNNRKENLRIMLKKDHKKIHGR